MQYIAEIVAEMLGRRVDDVQVLRCVLSVQAQVHLAMKNPVSRRLVPQFAEAADLDALAAHIAEFSIGGIRALASR
jgi:hypothetical protein